MNFFVLCLSAIVLGVSSVQIVIVNRCLQTIWPGIQGSTLPENGGFQLNAGQTRTTNVPNQWSGKIWARTGCNNNMSYCETGFCGNNVQCLGSGGSPPTSLAEFTLGGFGNQDYYDVSLTDGYNRQVTIQPIIGSYSSSGGQYECKEAGECQSNILLNCSQPLRLLNSKGVTVGCHSACTKFNTDQYCCCGAFSIPESCMPSNWPVNSATSFKEQCPTAYSYEFDDQLGSFFCKGINGRSANYRVTFC
uniref:Pathogenesis-related protein 5-like n=1 Tax=Rhabditophanes sp. KR3021 TaxID=114890 RepID=A0AC35UE24_9BILA